MYSWNHSYVDGCKWGVSDWTPAFEKEMAKALESNEPFDTDWVGCTKEIESFRIVRDDDGDACVDVWEGMDEGGDLIDDAIWDVFGGFQSEVDKSDIDEIQDLLWSDWDFSTETNHECFLSFKENSTTEEKIQQLKDALDEQIAFTHEHLDCSYNLCKETVKEFFTEKYGWEVKEK